MNTIIAFAGQAQSGKSTAASFIYSVSGVMAVEHSFALLLKEFCQDVLGLTYNQCNGTDADKNSLTEYKWEDIYVYFRTKYSDNPLKPKTGLMTAREVMQVQGEMQRRMFDKNIWVDALFRKINRTPEIKLNLISDCRHRNEVERCLELGGYIIHLTKKTNNSNADSEKEIDELDWNSYSEKFPGKVFQINNTHMTIEQKNECILQILKTIGVPL